MRRSIPNNGATYHAVKYHTKDEALLKKLQSLPVPSIDINYIGRMINAESNAENSINGLSIDETGIDFVNNHPDLFGSGRVYFSVVLNSDTPDMSLYHKRI